MEKSTTSPPNAPARKPRNAKNSTRIQSAGGLAKHGKTDAMREEQKAKVWALRKAGASFEVISKQIGCARNTAVDLYNAVIEDLVPVAEVDELRRVEAERIDELRMGLWQAARAGDTKAVTTWLRLTERYAMMLGLDMPQKQVLEIHMQQVKVEVSATLVRIINEAELDEAQRVAVLRALSVGHD
jgi:hypothetical protein